MRQVFIKMAMMCMVLVFGAIAIAAVETPRVSQKASVTQRIGLTDVQITFSRPGVKKRTIWGDLVPYDKVWRTGANEATTISFSTDVKVEGQNLPAGKYGLFTIPTQTGWTIIFNKDADQWGSNKYKQESDALRVQVKPEDASNQEWLDFNFQNLSPESADVVLRWEKKQVKFGIHVDTKEKVLASCRDAIANLKADDNDTLTDCTEYSLNNGGDVAEALKWANKAVTQKESFWSLSLKAEALAKSGNKGEAVQAAQKALTMTKDIPEEDVTGLKKKMDQWSSGK